MSYCAPAALRVLSQNARAPGISIIMRFCHVTDESAHTIDNDALASKRAMRTVADHTSRIATMSPTTVPRPRMHLHKVTSDYINPHMRRFSWIMMSFTAAITNLICMVSVAQVKWVYICLVGCWLSLAHVSFDHKSSACPGTTHDTNRLRM